MKLSVYIRDRASLQLKFILNTNDIELTLMNVSKEEFYKLEGSCDRTWVEFLRLRNNFIKTYVSPEIDYVPSVIPEELYPPLTQSHNYAKVLSLSRQPKTEQDRLNKQVWASIKELEKQSGEEWHIPGGLSIDDINKKIDEKIKSDCEYYVLHVDEIIDLILQSDKKQAIALLAISENQKSKAREQLKLLNQKKKTEKDVLTDSRAIHFLKKRGYKFYGKLIANHTYE